MITAMIGNYFSLALNNRHIALKKINYMLDEIAILIRFKSATVYEIIEHLAKDERFSTLDFIHKCHVNIKTDIPFAKIWEDAIDTSSLSYLQKEDISLIKSIGMNLGISDMDGQQSTIMLEKEELSTLIESAKNAYLSKSKLYRTLGILSGAFISIMII